MNIASDSDHDDTFVATKKEEIKDKLLGKSRINILRLRISELNDDLTRLKQNKIDYRLKLANLVENIKSDHIRFSIAPINTNKINKLFGRAF